MHNVGHVLDFFFLYKCITDEMCWCCLLAFYMVNITITSYCNLKYNSWTSGSKKAFNVMWIFKCFWKFLKGQTYWKKILTPVHTPYHVSPSWFKLLQSEDNTKNPVEKGNDGLYIICWPCPRMFLISNLIVLTPLKFHALYIGCHGHHRFTWKATYILYRPKKTKAKNQTSKLHN